MSETMPVTLVVNGEQHTATVHPLTRLLDFLRDHLRLTGTKEGCGEGECGACSVLVNGTLVVSCLVPMGQLDGADVLTIEGLAPVDAERLAPVQAAMLEEGGVQCGICTPGIVLAAHALLLATPRPTPAEIREALAGNICRCTGYGAIAAAVAQAAAGAR